MLSKLNCDSYSLLQYSKQHFSAILQRLFEPVFRSMIVSYPSSRPAVLLSLFWNTFLSWYLLTRPLQIIQTYFAYARTFWEMLSITFLLKTLISPWKNLTDAYPKNSLNLSQLAQTFTMNCTARMIGLIIRLSTIIIGLLVQIALLAFFIIYFLFWMTFPVIAVIGIQYLILTILP